MKVTYKGPLDAVRITATGQKVAQGETVEVDAELGAALVEQSDIWVAKAPAKAAKRTSTSSPATADDIDAADAAEDKE